jgi:hypothetical protein
MAVQAAPILSVLDRWAGTRSEDDVPTTALRDLLRDGKTTPLFASAKKQSNFEYHPKPDRPEPVRICFTKERPLVEKVKESLGDPKMKNPALGELLFDYHVESELD